MSLTKYFLSLSMLLGLGLAANAQTWQEPGGSVHSSEARYVVSANTTGCSTDLDYTNPSASNAVYTYTGAGMTVEQGQSFDLHVTSAEDMVWCHAVVFVDWNCDYDFDDEGEELFKVGSDVDDSDAPSDLVQNGNPEVADFTRTITVPADAAVGTTRMRIQFTDAWHIKSVDHPDHSAMDAVDKGGVYDFDVTITEAAAPVEGPTLVIGEHTNGQILVYTTDGEGVQTFYENGETLPLGWITAQFVADDGYTLQTPYFGSMDLTGSLEADNTFSIEVVEGTETVSFSAVFVEEAVEPEPSGWTIVAENTMSGATRDEVVEANVSSASRTLIASCSAGGVNRELTQSGYALLEGLPYCWGVGSPYPNDYVGYTVAVEETGTYKFSFQTRLDGTSTSSNATVELRYVEDGGNLSYATAVSASQNIPATTALPGTLLESNELELTAGTTYDFVVYVTSASANGSRLFIGDFKLYKKGAAPVEEAPVLTWATPENGTIAVTVAGETVESGVEVATGTEVVATFTPAEGYELETVTLGGEDVTTDVVDGVLTFVMGEEDVELAATFAETSTPEPADNLTAIQLTGASNTSTHSMFYFSEDDYGHGAEGNFYNGRSGNLTMSVWVNIHEAQGALMGYGQRWYNPEGVFTLSFDNGYYKLRNRTATEDHTACAKPTQEDVLEQAVETDTWAFVTVVFDTDNLMRYVYYNGEVVFEDVLETGGLGLLPDDCVFFVSNGVSGGWYFNSPTFDLDEVQVWDKALSADEVRASMTSVDPAAEGLISLYRFGADRMNENYTFDNLASAGSVTAALYTGSMYGSPGSITSSVAEPTFVEGHIAEAPENYEVTWTAPENGTLTIMNGDVELTSGAFVAEGTVLTVIAAPASGYQLDAVTVNDEPLDGTTFTVTGATVVAATFVPVQLENTLTVEAEHATVRVRDYNTLEEYPSGTVLETGTQLLVSAEADAGYEVTSVTVNGEEWPSYEPYTVDGPVHVVATAEALPMVTVNYTFEGEEYGSMAVYDVSGWSMIPIENGGSVEVGGAVNVMVTMNDNVEGTITVNGGEPVEFDSTTWEGLYTQRINITEDMETLDIAVVLTEAKAPENYYDFTYTIEGAELGDIMILDMVNYEPVESGASLGEGSGVGVQIIYAEGVDLTITINDVEQDIADNVVIMEGTCMYYDEITMDQDINLGIVLSQGTEPEGHTVTYALTGEAASAGTVYVNDMTDLSKLESGDTVADGADVNVQVTFDDQTVVGEMFVNGVSVGTFEYADNAGLYNYVVENVTADIDIEIELSYGNGIDSNLADGLKVYPTVFDEAVTVETPVDGSVTVYDMSGAAVYTSEVFEGSNSLPLGSLADGHYTLRVEGAGQSATVRVVKK